MQNESLEYIIVILDVYAPSFCYYGIPGSLESRIPRMQSRELKAIVDFAGKNGCKLCFVHGKDNPADGLSDIIAKSAYSQIRPCDSKIRDDGSILVMDKKTKAFADSLDNGSELNVILRLEKDEITELGSMAKRLAGKCKRLNVHLIGIESYEMSDIESYRNELSKLSETLVNEYTRGNAVEINCITDRILLKKMNNCNAGIDHVTFAPNGKFYICPGFYYDDHRNSIGGLDTGLDLSNLDALRIEKAPICSICDAYQCKRCVYLNKKATLDLNTPSYQQCVISHYEREASRKLIERLSKVKGFRDFDNVQPIPELDYSDPYKVILGEAKKQEESANEKKSRKEDSMAPSNTPSEKNNDKPGVITIREGDKVITLPRLVKVDIEKDIKPESNKSVKEAPHKQAFSPGGQANKIVKTGHGDEELEKMSTKRLLVEIYKMMKLILKEFNK